MATRWCPKHGYWKPPPGPGCPGCERDRNRRPRRRARGTAEWKQARAAAQRRDGYRCARCGLTNRKTRLEVHHIDGDPFNNDLANLETLCLRHHQEAGGGTPALERPVPRHRHPASREENVIEGDRPKK
jgi:5-methylcytosine-specific restriction endonuclease McrA